MKKIFTLIAAMLLVPWVGWGQGNWIDDANTSWYDENENTFEISTAEELAGLAKLVNEGRDNFSGKTITLTQPIDLNPGITFNKEATSETDVFTGTAKEWTPIGNNIYSFNGIFDGNNKKVQGVFIKNTTSDYNGLFGHIKGNNKNNAIITRLGITNSFIECNKQYIAGIVAFMENYSKVSYCYFDGLLSGENEVNMGGICASAASTASSTTIEYCYNLGNINAKATSDYEGIPGHASGLSSKGLCIQGIATGVKSIKYCYNAGNITISINNISLSSSSLNILSIGGIGETCSSSSSSKGEILSCYNTGNITVSGEKNENCLIGVGGISGTPSNVNIQYCYNYNKISANVASTFTGKDEAVAVGNIIGFNISTPPSMKVSFKDNYYDSTADTKNAVGGILFDSGTSEESGNNGVESYLFKNGFVAHALRDNGGYGQQLTTDGEAIDKTPVLLAFSENKGKEVYKLGLSIGDEEIPTPIYRNAIESNLLPEDTYQDLIDEENDLDLVWYKGDEIVAYGNTYTPTEDATLTAKIDKVYTIDTKVEPEEAAGAITVSQRKAQEGDKISFTVTANEGYELASITGVEYTKEDNTYTFSMPANNVVITAAFKAIETGSDDDDEGEGGTSTKRYQLFLADQDFYLNDEYDAEGLVLYSLHDKRYTKAGSSFTVWFEKNGKVNEGARVFISNRANGEYKEVKLDEVSGYYQIRNVQSNIYVKLYTEEGFPVANEAIEATEARAYAQANKIVVITPELTEVQIISMAGAVVATAQVAGQQEFANLTEGVYIVRMGESVVKLQVRN